MTINENFASFHIVGVKKEYILDLVNNLMNSPNTPLNLTNEQKEHLDFLKQKLGENFINEFKKGSFYETWFKRPLIGIECNSGYSFYSPFYEMSDIETEIALYFKYEDAPAVLGIGVEDGRYLRICIYNKCRIEADCLIDFKNTSVNDGIYKTYYKNIPSFEKYFGITKNDFKIIAKGKNLPYAFLYLKRFFDFRLELSYEDIVKNGRKYKYDSLVLPG